MPLRADHVSCSHTGPCDVRGEMRHSFTRLFAVVRSTVCERIDVLALLKSYGTASGRFRVLSITRELVERDSSPGWAEDSHLGCFGDRASSLVIAGKMPAFRDRLEAYPPGWMPRHAHGTEPTAVPLAPAGATNYKTRPPLGAGSAA